MVRLRLLGSCVLVWVTACEVNDFGGDGVVAGGNGGGGGRVSGGSAGRSGGSPSTGGSSAMRGGAGSGGTNGGSNQGGTSGGTSGGGTSDGGTPDGGSPDGMSGSPSTSGGNSTATGGRAAGGEAGSAPADGGEPASGGAEGTEGGSGGSPSECVPAGEESCDADNLDEDCDGQVNEDCDCTNGATNECGIDGGAAEICDRGQWTRCRCSGEQLIDTDENGTGDEGENLLTNPFFTADVEGWTFTTASGPSALAGGDHAHFEEEDAGGLECSGALWIEAEETSSDVWVEQCVVVNSGTHTAAIQTRLLLGNEDTGTIELHLLRYSGTGCEGSALDEQMQSLDIQVGDPWAKLQTSLTLPAGLQSVRFRVVVVGGVELDGGASYTTTRALLDNAVLHRP
jgi:hypothetical protein